MDCAFTCAVPHVRRAAHHQVNVVRMTEQENNGVANNSVPAEVWAARKRNNVRLAWAFGGLALFLFVMALWKLRPV